MRTVLIQSLLAVAAAAAPTAQFAKLPMSFEPNLGQARPGVDYIARGSGYSVQLSAKAAVISAGRQKGASLEITFPGGKALKGRALEPLPGTANYFLGKDTKAWKHDIPTYSKVSYAALYRGIDVVYYGAQGRLEYDFLVGVGADPGQVRIHFGGLGRPKLNESGELVFKTDQQTFKQHVPVAYQVRGGMRAPVSVHYRIRPDGDAAFELGTYDKGLPLTIDPTLSYSSYLGGNNNDGIMAVKVDATGSLYVAGFTASTNFKSTPGTAQASYQGRVANAQYFGFGDAFVAKLNPAGNALIYSTYLGGNEDDLATSLAVDSSGNAYVAGSTQSKNFPVTPGAFQTRFGGKADDAFYSRGDAFVVKLGPAGDKILWGTYVGGSSNDMAWAIAVDAAGNPTIVGDTISTDFPVTANAMFKNFRGGANSATNPSGDAFMARLNAAGSALQYATYIGGKSHDMARAVALDTLGNTYVAGGTYSSDFPTTAGALQVKGGVVETDNYDAASDDGWVMKINPQGAAVYSTYLGGAGRDTIFGLALDTSLNVYVTGRTKSTNFPVTANALQRTYGGANGRGSGGDSIDGDAFVAKINPAGAALVYSTFVGGKGDEAGSDIVVDANGSAYVVGYTLSTEFPLSADALQKTFAGFGGQGLSTGGPSPEGDVNTGDAFLLKLDGTGKLVYSSFFGGSADDWGTCIAIDSAFNVYVGGVTLSTNLTTVSPVQSAYGGGARLFPRGDAFFAKFDFGGRPAAVPARITFVDTPAPSGNAGAALGAPLTVFITDAGGAPITGAVVAFTATNATLDQSSVTTNVQGRASVTVKLGTTGTASVTASTIGLAPVSFSITVNAVVPGPSISAVVNGASFLAPIAPGSWMTLGGLNLASAQSGAAAVPLPTTLGGVRVRVNGNLVPLLFVIGNQINAQLPYETPVGNASVTVESNGIVSSPFSFSVQARAPGIFQFGTNRAVVQNTADDGSVSVNTGDNPARPGRIVLVYFTGQGALDNPVPTGDVASGALSRPTAPYSVTVGGQDAPIEFLGMTPGNISLGQANVHIPDLSPGDYPVVITINGQKSNGPLISVGPKP